MLTITLGPPPATGTAFMASIASWPVGAMVSPSAAPLDGSDGAACSASSASGVRPSGASASGAGSGCSAGASCRALDCASSEGSASTGEVSCAESDSAAQGAGSVTVSPDAAPSAWAGVAASPSSTVPVSKAAKPGGTQASAAARPSFGTPRGTASPAAKAVSIAVASAAFLSLRWVCAHSMPRVSRATLSILSLRTRDQKNSAPGRTCSANSMSSRATVASVSGRAFASKASWPLSVRATQAANSRFLSLGASALSAAKDSWRSSISSQSKGSEERSASMASPGLQSPKASSLTRSGGRSGVSRMAMSSAWS